MAAWIIISLAISALTSSVLAEECDKEVIRRCLDPSLNTLQELNIGQESKGLFLSAIEHYIMTLRNSYEDFIHLSSLNIVLTRIDETLMRPMHLRDACRSFSRTEKCVKDVKQWCDGEVRDQLEGLEEMFNFMCQDDKIAAYRANYLCLTRNTTLNSVRKDCSERLELGLLRVGQPFPSGTQNPKQAGTDPDENKEAVLFTRGIHIPRGDIEEEDIEYFSRSVCGLVNTALNCYHSSVEVNCPGDAADWTIRLRHTLVHLLLVDLQCEEYDSSYRYRDLYQQETCFQCVGNQSQCIDISLKCNSVEDCSDGSDEYEDMCDPKKGVNVTAIVITLAVIFVVFTIVIICVIKCRNNPNFNPTSGGGSLPSFDDDD